MTRVALLILILLFVWQFSTGQQPAKNSDVALIGLHGHVHSVLTEMVDNQGNPADSTLAVYDSDGYLLGEYRYEPDGSLHSHTKYTRKEWQVYRTETSSSVPSENRTFVQSFNSDGLVTGTETYDGTGALIGSTRNDFTGEKRAGATESTSNDVKSDGTPSVVVTVDQTNPTGLSHQSAIKDGKPYYNWMIERNADGKPVSDVMKYADGSFNEREVRPDGTTVEHKYWAPTKTHTNQTTDEKGYVLEVIDDSPGYYAKTIFRYDEAGRETEIANYDRFGKLLRKCITKYDDDANGNWIEQREYNWDAALSNKKSKLASVNRRTITYY